jgi:secondary thiamine-phosphate synthase enzyme
VAHTTNISSMRTHQVECTFTTSAVPDFVDITERVQELVDESRISAGQVTVFSPSSGCSLIANERETGLLRDIETTLARLGGPAANGRPIIGTNSLVLPAVGGRLRLGTWQRVLLVELEEAGSRSVIVQIVGE